MAWLLAQAQDTTAPQQPGGGQLGILVPLALMLPIFWLLVWRPQSKHEKARRAKLDAIKKGDRVRTRGGIEGVVARVQDDAVVLKIDTDGKIQVQFAKAYVDDVLADESAAAEEKK